MGVTIDNLQIEIQSSSASAKKGIDEFSASLEKLKKSGSFKTVSNNLNNLSNAIRGLPNVHQASNSLRTLANSIEQLKSAGTISSLTNSMSKLPAALKSLSDIDLTETKAMLDGVADAVSPISQIKAGGLSSMVNAMKNLGNVDFGEITKNLEGDAIDGFIEKVQLLNEKLGPLSEKMTVIKSGFTAINSKARSAASGVEDFGDEINASALNISSFIEIARTAADTVMNLVRVVTEFMHDAMQWDGIEYQFGNAFGEQADIYYEKITKITDALKLNKQMFMENSAMATSMLVGFGVNAEDAREMGLGYTQLAYDIWAAFNNVYENFDGADGAMAAVRSAIAGEVEPIRRAGFTIVESQLEQTAANHGLKISIEGATEAQKSYLRYLELVDQAHRKGIVGTYASEMQTAEGLVRTLKQQWVSLTQAVASLFIPILVKILPYIQAMVDLLKEGVQWLANLLGIEIQAVDFSDYKKGTSAIDGVADSAGGATDALNSATKAAKELKNATLGIDELNVISPNSGSSSSGGSGSSGSGAGDGFSGLDVSSLWDESIFDTVKSDVDAIKEKLKGWLPVIATAAGALAGLRLLNLLGDMEKIKKLNLFGGLTGGLKSIGEYLKAAKQMAPEVGWLAALFPKLSAALSGLPSVISGVVSSLAGISAPVWAGIAVAVAAVASAIYFLVENWDEFKKAVKDWIAVNLGPKLEEIKNHIENVKKAFEPFVIAIQDFFDSPTWKTIKDGFLKFVEGIGALTVALTTGALMGAIKAIAGAIENLVQIISGNLQALAGVIDIIVGMFTLDGQKIVDGSKKIIDGVADVFKGLIGLPIDWVKDFFTGVVNWFTELWDVLVGHSIVPDTINSIVQWFTSLPSKIFGSIEKFVTGIVDKFKGLWSKLVSWWNGKTKLKEYTPSIGSIYDKLKSRWDSARTWWNDKKTKAKEYTPSIGSIYEKLSDRWKNARDWWNNKKGSMSYTPSIGSIVDKVKSAWNTAKSWWNKNVKLSTKLDIKVPKLTVNWGEVSALGKTFKYPKSFSLKFAANGGIFDQGSMIWAGERGPEILANAAGGKTGVMNIQQMQDAVYEGVYAAVSAAMRGMNGGEQAVNVYLDGKQITAAVEQRQRERGASIMGNEVYSY